MTAGYIVCATPRSGSGLLCDALRSTGVGGDPQEWYARGMIHHWLGEWGIRGASSTWEEPVMAEGGDYASRVRTAATIGGVFSMKIHWNQWELFGNTPLLPSLESVCGTAGELPPAVLIRRFGLVEQAVSGQIAQATKVFLRRRGQPARRSLDFAHVPPAGVFYDYSFILDQIIHILEHEARWAQFLKECRIPCHEVWYEDLVTNISRTCADVMSFLGINGGMPPKPELERQADDTNSYLIDRFRRDFTRSDAAHMLPQEALKRLGM